MMYSFGDLLFSTVEADETRRALPVAFVYVSDLALAFFNFRLGALQHTWSLAIEEHFYLVWPLVLSASLRLGISREVGVAHVASSRCFGASRATLHQFGAPPVRTYYGIDTRADALLIGCAAGMA